MRRTLLILSGIGIAVSFAACHSQDYVDEGQGQEIQASAPFIYRGTRASGDITSSTIRDHEFKVWANTSAGATVFDGQTFYWNGLAWTYSPTVKWEGRTISFAAIAPTENNGGIPNGDYKYASGTQRFTIDNIPMYQKINNGQEKSGMDYLVSEVLAGRTQADGDLQFSFHHILSKLRVFARFQTDGQTYDGVVSQLQLQLLNGTAQYQQVNPIPSTDDQWTLSPGESNWTDLVASKMSLSDEYEEVGSSFFLVPQQDIELKMNIKFSYKVALTAEVFEKEYTDVIVQGISSFTQGKLINLYITIQPGQLGNINFKASVGNWDEDQLNQNIFN